MSNRATPLSDALHDYLLAYGVREHPALAALRAETAELPLAIMQISPEQGALMQLLVELIDARNCLEVGVFTGYSAMAVALALPEGGRITALDINEEWTDIARRHWRAAGIEGKIDLRLAPALESLDALIADGALYDFAFIDADKTNYGAYYERCLTLVRPGGLIAIDNCFYAGHVLDDEKSENAAAVDALNRRIRDDSRVSIALAPIGDGLLLARRRAR